MSSAAALTGSRTTPGLEAPTLAVAGRRPGQVILHLITDFSAPDGAQTMLSRLVGAEPDRPAIVASLREAAPSAGLSPERYAALYQLGARSALGFPAAVTRAAALIRRERPTAILCWMYHAMVVGLFAARLAGTGTRLVWTVRQSLDDPSALSPGTRLALRAASRLSGAPDAIIYNSERARLAHLKIGFCDAGASVIPNGFVLPPLSPMPPRTPRVFGIAGRVHPQKDHATFFRAAAVAAAADPDIRFVAAGRGATPELAPAAAASGLDPQRIEFRGPVDDMPSFYRHIDALILSSRTEGFPNVVAEAMAHGRPVVTTDVGDAAAIVGETGIVVPAGDAQALAAGMLTLVRLSPSEYAVRCAAARDRIGRNYALDDVAARYHRVLAGEAP